MTSPTEVTAEPAIGEPRKSPTLPFKTPSPTDKPALLAVSEDLKGGLQKPASPTSHSDSPFKESSPSEARPPKKQWKPAVSGNVSVKAGSTIPSGAADSEQVKPSEKLEDAPVQLHRASESSNPDCNNSTTSTAPTVKAPVSTASNDPIDTPQPNLISANASSARVKTQSTQNFVNGSAKPTVFLPTNAPIADDDVVFVDGQAFNGRGYPVCGVANQRGKRCGRIGTCPFHSGARAKARAANPSQSTVLPSKPPAKRPRSAPTLESILPASTANPAADGPSLPISAATENDEPPAIFNANGKRSRTAQVAKREVAIPPRRARFKRSWTPEEHRLFLTAMRRHGRGKWKEIAADVKTRTANQCQSHAQKYFLRQAKSDSERKKKSIHDVTDIEVGMDDAISPSAVVIQQPSSTALVPASSSKPVVILPRTSQAVPLAPGPAPSSNSMVVSRDGGTLVHRVSPTSVSTSALLTCTGRGATVPTVSSQTLTTVPVVFPVSNYSNMQYAPLMQPVLNSGNASSAAVVPPPPLAKLRVTVHINGKLKGGMALVLPDSLDQFFEQAKSKLNFVDSFSRVFTRSGGEITCIDEMCPDDMLWLSAGEDFTTPR